MHLRGLRLLLRASLAPLLLAGGCDDQGIGVDRFDGDFLAPPMDLRAPPDLAVPLELCKGVVSSGQPVRTAFVGPPELPFPIGGDGQQQLDSKVTLDGSGAVVLASSGGLPEPTGRYAWSQSVACGAGQLLVHRLGWVVETPPNAWVNVATRVGQLPSLMGAGWTANGDKLVVDVEQKVPGGTADAQFDVSLFTGDSKAKSPTLRRLYVCYECD